MENLTYNINNWFWIVQGNTTQVFSSKVFAYVPLTDAGYINFLAIGGVATTIDSHTSLKDVVNQPIKDQLVLIDIKSIRSLREGNNAISNQHNNEAIALRSKLLN